MLGSVIFLVSNYSYLSNKRSPTIILFGKIIQALRGYKRPLVYLFLKKIIEKLGENRKKVAIFKSFFI